MTINTHEGKRGSLIKDLDYQRQDSELDGKQKLLKQIVDLGFKKFSQGVVILNEETK